LGALSRISCRKLISQKPPSNDEKVAIDHILDAQKNGEINEDNVLYIIENINVAGRYSYNNGASKYYWHTHDCISGGR
jgi:hypothetical protein